MSRRWSTGWSMSSATSMCLWSSSSMMIIEWARQCGICSIHCRTYSAQSSGITRFWRPRIGIIVTTRYVHGFSWHHTMFFLTSSFQSRLRYDRGISEDLWARQFNELLHRDFNFTHDLPAVFIDTFYYRDNPVEVEKFHENTEKLRSFAQSKLGNK